MVAGLLVLGALLLFAMPSPGHAAPCHDGMVKSAEVSAPGVNAHAPPVVVAMVMDQHGGGQGACDHHPGKGDPPGCCAGGVCSLMHSGVTPSGLLPEPLPDGTRLPLTPSPLFAGLRPGPAYKPPRASI